MSTAPPSAAKSSDPHPPAPPRPTSSPRPSLRTKPSPDPARPPSYHSPPSETADPPQHHPLPPEAPSHVPPPPVPASANPTRPPSVSASARRMPSAAPRRTQRSRLGRPPNINENSLMRRLECVMAVESAHMSMLAACQRFDISARTFYRWLRDKNRLMELTGCTEDDFRSSPPASWGLDQERPPDDTHDRHHHTSPAPRHTKSAPPTVAPHENLPRLPAVEHSPPNSGLRPSDAMGASASTAAAVAAVTNPPPPPPPPPAPSANYMGMKRRFPKGSSADPSRRSTYPSNSPSDRYDSGPNHPPAYYAARRAFTKMPPANGNSRDTISAERHAARASTRMRRQDCPPEPLAPQRYAPEPHYSQSYRRSRSNSPSAPFKRRKVMMERTPSADEADQSIGHLEDERHVASPGSREYRNIPEYERGHREREEDRRQPEVRERTPPPVGQRAVADVSSSDEETGRHRIEIMMGRRKVILAWYKGASTEDIKTSIARRFALLPGTQWALMDQNYDEIIVSAGVPSGRYTLTVFS